MARAEQSPGPWTLDMPEEMIVDINGKSVGRFHAGREDGGNDARPVKANMELILEAWRIPALKAENARLREALTKTHYDLSVIVADHKLGKDRIVMRAMDRIREELKENS